MLETLPYEKNQEMAQNDKGGQTIQKKGVKRSKLHVELLPKKP